MIYQILQNPLTQDYLDFKRHVLSEDFQWNYRNTTSPLDEFDREKYTANTMYQHRIVQGPSRNCDRPLPDIQSHLVGNAETIVKQILAHNDIQLNFIFRMVVNSIWYSDGKPSVPHVDHEEYNHKNLIVYLNQFEKGNIDVIDDDGSVHTYKPNEDDVITFTHKYHSIHQPSPADDRRVAFVATYL
tara:strand:+ start:190 stop:747 length:558 start_codon:yes stop_codon:yes gene_type:complete